MEPWNGLGDLESVLEGPIQDTIERHLSPSIFHKLGIPVPVLRGDPSNRVEGPQASANFQPKEFSE